MKFLKKAAMCLIATGVIASTLIMSNIVQIHASSISISANPSSVNPGGSFTVNVTINGGGSGMFYFSGSNATVSIGSQFCDTSCSITATAGTSGTASVTVSTGQAGTVNEVADLDGNPITFSSAVSVNITPPNTGGNSGGNSGGSSSNGTTTPQTPASDKGNEDEKKPEKDSNSILASLSIDKGTLSPAFSSSVTDYKVNLPAGTTEFKVDAKAKNEKATVEGIGTKAVKVGDNTITIRCVAEDGSATSYTIIAHVSEKPVAYLKYKNKKLGLLNEAGPASKLFTETKLMIDDKEVIAWENRTLGMTLVYMRDETDNRKDFYVYDTKNKEVTSIFRPFTYNNKNLIMIDVPEELQKREGMKFTTIKLGDYELPGWQFKDKVFKNYALLYVMDEAGNIKYYQYERNEDNLQVFSQAAAITQDDYQKFVEKTEKQNMIYLIVIGVMAVVLVGLTTAFIVMMTRRKNQVRYRKVPITDTALSAEAKSLLHDDK